MNQMGAISEKQEVDVDVDVVVVGAGGGGLAAALAVADSGRSVIVLEKLDRPGGNSALSTGSIPAAGSRLQIEAGIVDFTGPNGHRSDCSGADHMRQRILPIGWHRLRLNSLTGWLIATECVSLLSPITST